MKKVFPLLFLFPLIIHAQDFPQKPDGSITDFDPFYNNQKTLSPQELQLLSARLRAFEDSTGIQLFIFLTSQRPVNPGAYAQKVFSTWHLGQGDKGSMLLSVFTGEPTFTFHTARAIEAEWPNEECIEILDRAMSPDFVEGNFYTGLDAGINTLMRYAKHGYESPGVLEQLKEKIPATLGIAVLTLPFIVGLLYRFMRNKRS
ncbi:MAG: TPM domain-containing protein [Cyclobacteriaceae bacterium]|nr:MAG: TPM domain-containing protein [Cyclobacteriaceae bacterium]